MEDPSPEAWHRLWRYASWMRQLCVDWLSTPEEDALCKLRLNSPASRPFPALQDLTLFVTESNLPYADLFFSPHLKKISVYTVLLQRDSEIPRDVLPIVASTIFALPASALQYLHVDISEGYCKVPLTYFTDSLSSVVLRCGPSLVEFVSPIPLSDVATNHLIHLPHLRTWFTIGPPPSYSALSLPLVFPPLTEFVLGDGAVGGWLSLICRLEHSVSTPRGVTPLSKMKELLNSLYAEGRPGPTIDVALTSAVQVFRNLVHLNVPAPCHQEHCRLQCAFELNNDNVAELAMALPQLETLLLGDPCFENTCATNVACLLSISVHCIGLRQLKIHFNTTNIVDDLKKIPGDPRFRGLLPLPKCRFSRLVVRQTPLTLDEPDIETVANGIIDIFPSLIFCEGRGAWHELCKRIGEVQERRQAAAACGR